MRRSEDQQVAVILDKRNNSLIRYLVEQGFVCAISIAPPWFVLLTPGACDGIDIEANIYDSNTTAVLDKESISWQLSICAYFSEIMGNEVKTLYAVPLRGNECTLREIERKPNEEVKKLIECYLKNEPYVSTLVLTNDEALQTIYDAELMLIEIENEAKRYKEIKEKALSLLEKQMQDAGVKTFETERLKVTRVRKGYLKLTIKK